MRVFSCSHCQQRIFFENTVCGQCQARLGFVPAEADLVAFAPEGDWVRFDGGAPQRPCANYGDAGVCNWMVPLDDAQDLCACCRTTAVIPALEKPENHSAWAKLEAAKRRLFYTLAMLKLAAPSRAEAPETGIAFEFLEETPDGPQVLTGHDNGTITLNIAEADDARRESIRLAMHEPYRTLLGHFRHESGHYFWDRLIANTHWLPEFRALFGDEQADYAEALQRHYEQPAADWSERFISAYASSHPWEDWAECWAHYLHMADGLETAAAWGMRLDQAAPGAPPLVVAPLDLQAEDISGAIFGHWLPVAQVSNAMNRSLGTADAYPFVMPEAVVHKLAFIHRVVRSAPELQAAERAAAAQAPAEGAGAEAALGLA